MYDTETPDSKGPYYVPWKKTSMDLYKKTKENSDKENLSARIRYKPMDGYIPGSTIGNVPTEDKSKKDEKKDN